MFTTSFVELVKSLHFKNLDLLTVGISVAAISILGFVIFLNNRNSITNKTFASLASWAMLWSVINYLSYQTNDHVALTLVLMRLVLFSATWFAYHLYKLSVVFPENDFVFSKPYKYYLVPATALTSLLTLTPFVFPRIVQVSAVGSVSKTEVAAGIAVFGAMVMFLIFGSFYHFIKKTISAKPADRAKYRLILVGTVVTFSLIIVFNFIYPALFLEVNYIPMGGLFILPFIGFTGYAIFKHRLFNVKNIIAALFTFFLCDC